MIDPALRKLAVPIDSVQPHPRNEHHQGDVGAIVMSLRRFGQVRPIVVQKSTGYVCAGNHVWKAMKAEGETKIAVVTPDLSEEEALAYLIADNRTPELGTTDDAGLAEILTELQAAGLLDGTGYDDEDLGRLLDDLARDGGAGRDDDAPAPDPPDDPVSRLGEVYDLGPHRLMCGDATDHESLAILLGDLSPAVVIADPPYGIDLDTDFSKVKGSRKAPDSIKGMGKTYRPVIGDDRPFDAAAVVGFFEGVREQFWFGADYYRRTLSPVDTDGSWMVWDKRTPETDTVVGSGFELIWSRRSHKRDVLRFYWCGAFGSAEARGREHPTQKPVALLSELINRYTARGDVVADPFAGSGSTLIAAHRLGRRAYLMEIDPRYCDVIRARYEAAVLNVPTTVTTGA